MACCGNRRTALTAATTPPGAPMSPNLRAGGSLPPGAMVRFEYVGAGTLTVRGAATGISYRFEFPGARRLADARDAPALATIASLRRV